MSDQSIGDVPYIQKKAQKIVSFCKMQSLGNDFMVVDAVTTKVHFPAERIRQLADRHRGVGFDQLLVVEPPYDPDLDFHYRIFNADGSEVAQCGNGACALAHFLHLKGLTNRREIGVSTQSSQLILRRLTADQVSVTLTEPNFEPQRVPFLTPRREKQYVLQLADQTVSCGVVSVGNPHCVVLVDNCDMVPVDSLGEKIARHEYFTQQTNVGFMEIITPQHIRLRVYERGVGETQACGSGACAAVAIGIDQGVLAQTVQVDLPGGTLQVRWRGPRHPLYLISTATHVYEGMLHL